jgi:hypothetical protein
MLNLQPGDRQTPAKWLNCLLLLQVENLNRYALRPRNAVIAAAAAQPAGAGGPDEGGGAAPAFADDEAAFAGIGAALPPELDLG